MADRNVTIRISAQDQFSDVFQRYERALGKANTETRSMGRQSDTTAGQMRGLGTAIGGMVAAIGLNEVIQFGSRLQELGTKANNADSVFRQLTGGVSEAQTTLRLLRDATNGTVSDMELMQSANALLLQGLADTNEKAADLTGIAVTLGRAMGEDVNTSIANFSQLLRNQSIRLLDNFGLSSSRVNARIVELQESTAGLSREQAFVTATIEEANRAIGRLGDSSVVTGTATERLQARLDNLMQDAGSNIAYGVEGIIESIERLGNAWEQSAIDARLAVAQQEAAMEEAARLSAEIAAQTGIRTDEQLAADTGYQQSHIGGARSMMVDRMMQGDFAGMDYEGQVQALMQASGYTRPTDALDMARELLGSYNEINDIVLQTNIAQESHTRTLEAQAATTERIRQAEADRAATIDRDTNNMIAAGAAAMERQLAIQHEQNRVMLEQVNTARTLAALRGEAGVQADVSYIGGLAGAGRETMQQYTGEGRTTGFYTSDQAGALSGTLADAEARLAHIQDLYDQGMVTQSTLSRAQAFTDEVRAMADAAERGAAAFENISLSAVFGQTDGGMAGEIGGAITDYAQRAGMSPEQIAELQRSISLTTGQQTESSLYFQEQVLPTIIGDVSTGRVDAEGAARATANINSLLEMAALSGLDQSQITGLMQSVTQRGMQEVDMGYFMQTPGAVYGEGFNPAAYMDSMYGTAFAPAPEMITPNAPEYMGGVFPAGYGHVGPGGFVMPEAPAGDEGGTPGESMAGVAEATDAWLSGIVGVEEHAPAITEQTDAWLERFTSVAESTTAMSDDVALTNENMALITENTDAWLDSISQSGENLATTQTAVDQIKSDIDDLVSNVQTVQVNISVGGPGASIIQRLAAGTLGGTVNVNVPVTGAGGTSGPNVDPTTGRIVGGL